MPNIVGSGTRHAIGVRYEVTPRSEGWELFEGTVPESVMHDEAVDLLRDILEAWASRIGGTQVARNLAIRWDQTHPKVGIDPDVAVLRPPPPRGDDNDLKSLRTWLPGHEPPVLAIEVVSESHPYKDYVIAPDKYAASGTRELWVFDPKLVGPLSHGGPFPLQIWQRDESFALHRTYAGSGPARSGVLDAFAVVVEDGQKLRIADKIDGSSLWLTPVEAERAAKEAALAATEAAYARVAELEAKLAAERERR